MPDPQLEAVAHGGEEHEHFVLRARGEPVHSGPVAVADVARLRSACSPVRPVVRRVHSL